MKTWKIKVLKMGEYTINPATLNAADSGSMKKVPAWSVAVYDDDTKIIIDTGVHDVQWVNDHVEIFSRAEDEEMVAALDRYLGWIPEDIDIVINTHLHYDHCGNNSRFTNAEFYLQRRELEIAYHPLSMHRNIYLTSLFDAKAVNYTSWRLLDGEYMVAPGLMVFPTPGHSAGHQSVLISSEQGVVCVCGDVCNTVENLWKNSPPGIITSNTDVLKSYEDICMRAEYFIPGHEPGIKNLQEKDFPRVRIREVG